MNLAKRTDMLHVGSTLSRAPVASVLSDPCFMQLHTPCWSNPASNTYKLHAAWTMPHVLFSLYWLNPASCTTLPYWFNPVSCTTLSVLVQPCLMFFVLIEPCMVKLPCSLLIYPCLEHVPARCLLNHARSSRNHAPITERSKSLRYLILPTFQVTAVLNIATVLQFHETWWFLWASLMLRLIWMSVYIGHHLDAKYSDNFSLTFNFKSPDYVILLWKWNAAWVTFLYFPRKDAWPQDFNLNCSLVLFHWLWIVIILCITIVFSLTF